MHTGIRSHHLILATLAFAFTTLPTSAQPQFNPGLSCNTEQLAVAGQASPPALGPGRDNPILLRSYPNFDYWSLDSCSVRDSLGNVHFGVRLWEYNNYTDNYDRFTFDSNGQLLDTALDWVGIGNQPVVTDDHGLTPASLAAVRGHSEVVDVLKAHGAIVQASLADLQGTPVSMALDEPPR